MGISQVWFSHLEGTDAKGENVDGIIIFSSWKQKKRSDKYYHIYKGLSLTSGLTLASKFWGKKVKIPLFITVLPPFSMYTCIWKH